MPENVITSSDLKSILHSGCANIYSQEKYLIQVNGGHVEYITQDEENSFYWNIPITNTIAIMPGASVTQMVMRELPRAGVMVGFCRKDGTSLYFANEVNQHCEDWPERQLNADWNSLSHKPEKSGWSVRNRQNVWKFTLGTPLRSQTWCEKAWQVDKRIKTLPALLHSGTLDNLLTFHLARLSLMLVDHVYPSQPVRPWLDQIFTVCANSNRQTRPLNQKLDEHPAGVDHFALLMASDLREKSDEKTWSVSSWRWGYAR